MNTPPAGAAHLPASAYRLGMRVQFKSLPDLPALCGIVRGTTDEGGIDRLRVEVGKFPYFPLVEHCKPIMRGLKSLTEDEARQIYQIDMGKAFDPSPIWPEDNEEREATEWLTYSEYLDGIDMSELDRFVYGWKVLEYLDSLHIDYRGWLAQGLAVDASTL